MLFSFLFFFVGDFTIKIYNKQNKIYIYIFRFLLFKSLTPSGSYCGLLCVFSFSFPKKKKSPLFTLQQSLLYARPPLRQSPAQPCIAPLSSHHFQVCLHCFPCFRSQHDKAINRQLERGNIAQRIAYCVPVCALFEGMRPPVCVFGTLHSKRQNGRKNENKCLTHGHLTFIKAHSTAFISCICGPKYVKAFLIDFTGILPHA